MKKETITATPTHFKDNDRITIDHSLHSPCPDLDLHPITPTLLVPSDHSAMLPETETNPLDEEMLIICTVDQKALPQL